MFTGIIQAVGAITQINAMGSDRQLTVASPALDMTDVQTGDSIAVNGVCLTVVTHNKTQFTAHVSQETLSVTTGLDGLHAVNLEKALRLSDRLGGHLVSGHVDATGQVIRFEPLGDCWRLDIKAPHAISKYIAIKGSICINGVSLTVNALLDDAFSINLIPHTLENTTLKLLGVGCRVNLEVDQIARYVERMTTWQQNNDEPA